MYSGNHNEMFNVGNGKIDWPLFIEKIKSRTGAVVPVIGSGVLRLRKKDEETQPLYDYLADRLQETMGIKLNPGASHKFARSCYYYLKNTNLKYFKLSAYLNEEIEKVLELIDYSTIEKLARIKGFDTFVTTTYDSILANTIREIRGVPPKVLSYSPVEKKLATLNPDSFTYFQNPRSTLVYHIFGDTTIVKRPAYTESDIIENIVELQKDLMSDNPQHLSEFINQDFLFIGCGYDDWLLRFLIRTLSEKPFPFPATEESYNVVSDDFSNCFKFPFYDFPDFFLEHLNGISNSKDSVDFVDTLFHKISVDQNEVYKPSDYRFIAFISFDGRDRPVALRLKENLLKEDINVWVDSEIRPADQIDERIIETIKRCPVFIPLVSQNSKWRKKWKIINDEPPYHIQEWEWAFFRSEPNNDSFKIIPVRIDGTEWKYKKFDRLAYLSIPGGHKGVEDYVKLCNELENIKRRMKND